LNFCLPALLLSSSLRISFCLLALLFGSLPRLGRPSPRFGFCLLALFVGSPSCLSCLSSILLGPLLRRDLRLPTLLLGSSLRCGLCLPALLLRSPPYLGLCAPALLFGLLLCCGLRLPSRLFSLLAGSFRTREPFHDFGHHFSSHRKQGFTGYGVIPARVEQLDRAVT